MGFWRPLPPSSDHAVAEPTAADRERACQLEATWHWNTTAAEERAAIAQALADERAWAVENVLALVHTRDLFGDPCRCKLCRFGEAIVAAIERGETP
jgi:hypothetical protein